MFVRVFVIVMFLMQLSFLPARAGFRIEHPVPINPKLFVVTIGINQYELPASPLRFCRHDAIELAETLKIAGAKAFTSVETTVLLDNAATKEGIEQAMSKIQTAAGPMDTVIFHFSGFSQYQYAKICLVPFGAEPYLTKLSEMSKEAERSPGIKSEVDLGKNKIIDEKFLSVEKMSEWCKKTDAGNFIFILDSNNSAEFNDQINIALREKAHPESSNAVGYTVFSIEGEEADYTPKKHGLLSYCVLEALKGAADLTGNGKITARELTRYVATNMPKLSAEAVGAGYSEEVRVRISQSRANFLVAQNDALMRTASAIKMVPKEQTQRQLGKQRALIIATSNYDEFKHLPNPIRDAEAIKKELEEFYGWEVKVVENPTWREMKSILAEYRNKQYDPINDQLFILISGHGLYDESLGDGFIVAKDSVNEDTMREKYISFADLCTLVDGGKCPHILLGLDICFGGAFLETQRVMLPSSTKSDMDKPLPVDEVLRRKMPLKTRKVITAGANEPVYDGTDNSPFVKHILEELRSGKFLRFTDIAKRVENTRPGGLVADFGTNKPGSDFLFIPKENVQTLAPDQRPDSFLDDVRLLNETR